MTMMTRLLPLLTLAVTLVFGALPGLAQSSGSFSPVITVNGSGITAYEINQRLRFMQLLNAAGTTPKDAEEALIQDRLRISASHQVGLKLDEAGLEKGMAEFAGRANLTNEKFLEALKQNGVDPATFRDFVRAGMLWRELVRARFGAKVFINDAAIDRAMMQESQVGKGVKVLISEAIIPAPPGNERNAMGQARQLSATKGEAAFAALARKYSATASRNRGGRLDWMPIENLPVQLRAAVLALKPGTATAPITLKGAVAVFMLRAIGDGSAPSGPQSLSYMTFNLGATGSEQAAKLAGRVATDARRCNELYTIAKGLPASALTAHDGVTQAQVPTDIGLTLAHLDIGETEVLSRGGSDTLVMLCNRESVPGKDEVAPTRDQVRAQLENNALASYAEGYLADLEADAVIVRK
ncbi:peptidylprolyl isomerase [uncultured Thioclava sp.]|jgi:peptidyl-prolyl cis-trans isomerase SurA|uniref:peptidylprolyl isomerase n=1 Tax=uncultured Thioclava sp. TaxID=473858 RepID=UPI0025F57055|nr:peptidylprolyl isomerase [uncultured Thioclava sp.]